MTYTVYDVNCIIITCDMTVRYDIHTESSKVQEVYKLLLPLKSWLAELEEKMASMRPAAVLSTPLSDQITENDVRMTCLSNCHYPMYVCVCVCVCVCVLCCVVCACVPHIHT